MSDERLAVAIAYEQDAPRILATARGVLCEAMLELARAHGITVYEDADLAAVLSRFPAGSAIPEALFSAVAKVLAYCYRVNASFRDKLRRKGFAS